MDDRVQFSLYHDHLLEYFQLNMPQLAQMNLALITAGLIAGIGALAMLYVARAQDRAKRRRPPAN